LPRLIAMALRSIASFTKRSVSSRIACFDISRSLAFCKIGHRAGRTPQQRRCYNRDALAESRVFVADGERVSTDQEARSRGVRNRFH
jgi:hypothetical protein